MAKLRNYFVNDINSTTKMYPKIKASQVYIPSLNKTLEQYYGTEVLTFQEFIDKLIPVGIIIKSTKEIDFIDDSGKTIQFFDGQNITWAWSELEPGCLLVGEGTYTDSVGDTATFAIGENVTNTQQGELFHLLTVNEMPSHLHYMPWTGSDDGRNTDDTGHGSTDSSHWTANCGGQTPHNNIQPVKVIHAYKRIS